MCGLAKTHGALGAAHVHIFRSPASDKVNLMYNSEKQMHCACMGTHKLARVSKLYVLVKGECERMGLGRPWSSSGLKLKKMQTRAKRETKGVNDSDGASLRSRKMLVIQIMQERTA